MNPEAFPKSERVAPRVNGVWNSHGGTSRAIGEGANMGYPQPQGQDTPMRA